jgi:hypothetical protein
MSYQTSFAEFDYNHIKRQIRREVFLSEMEQTATNVAYIHASPKLLRDSDRSAGYTRDEYRRGARHLGMRWCVNDNANLKRPVVQPEKAQP